MANYRVLVEFVPERSVFTARVPELEHCSGEGATRAEAIAKAEEEMNAQLANIRERGGNPPAALDGAGSDAPAAFDGKLALTVSRSLHRDLVWQARLEGVEVGALVAELLPVALEQRRQRRRPSNPQTVSQASTVQGVGDEGGGNQRPSRDDRGSGNRGNFRGDRGGGGGRHHALMEDRAAFLEYVRGLDSGQGGPRQGGGAGGGRRGGGGGGGRRGGPGGGGPGGGGPGGGGPGGGGPGGGSPGNGGGPGSGG